MSIENATPPAPTDPDRDFGVLLGWEADPAGGRVMLKMQSAQKAPRRGDEVREFRYYMTREQAVLLGNYLFRLAGETAPRREKHGFLRRLMG